LGGGGAKGAYQVGAWKAFNELGIKFRAIIGTSVGALNGVLMVMGNIKKSQQTWESLTLDKIIKIPEGFIKDGKFTLDQKSILFLKDIRTSFMKDGGLDTAPLHQIILDSMDERKVRKAGLDIGIVTFQITDRKPMVFFLEDIPEGKLDEYLLASSTFPGFKSPRIEGKQFIDGGLYDNLPFDIAKQRGYKRIIMVDVSGIGVNKKPDIIGTETIYIKNSIDMGSVFEFEPGFIKSFIRLGYLDTMKTFGKLSGIAYFYYQDKVLEKKLKKLLLDEVSFCDYKEHLTVKDISYNKDELDSWIRETLPENMRAYKQIVYSLAECAALLLNLPRIELYSFNGLLREIWRTYQEKTAEDPSFPGPERKNILEWLGFKAGGSIHRAARIFFTVIRRYFEKAV
jgi:NTE family protein